MLGAQLNEPEITAAQDVIGFAAASSLAASIAVIRNGRFLFIIIIFSKRNVTITVAMGERNASEWRASPPSQRCTLWTSFVRDFKGLRGLYADFFPAVLASSVPWGLYFFFYGRAKQRYSISREEKLSPGLHLASAAEAGALVSLCTNPIWLIKTRLQLQISLHQS